MPIYSASQGGGPSVRLSLLAAAARARARRSGSRACPATSPRRARRRGARRARRARRQRHCPVVLLEERDGSRWLPIWIGTAEAQSIAISDRVAREPAAELARPRAQRDRRPARRARARRRDGSARRHLLRHAHAARGRPARRDRCATERRDRDRAAHAARRSSCATSCSSESERAGASPDRRAVDLIGSRAATRAWRLGSARGNRARCAPAHDFCASGVVH